MCQGAIVSIVRFGKKQIVLSGIGSHSTLIEENKKLLGHRGWKENLPYQSVVGYESDFTQGKWGRFTLEGGDPRKGDEKIAKAEFKKISGSASALIKHIQKHKKIDAALLALLTAQARKVFDETTAPARKVFDETTAQAQKVSDETTAPAQKVLNETYGQARKVFDETYAQAQKVLNETYAQARKVFDETTAQARKVFDETYAQAFIKIFRNPKNRIIK